MRKGKGKGKGKGEGMRTILGIEITDRDEQALKVQELLTKHGCIIKTRLGLHATGGSICSPEGFLVLEIEHTYSGEFVNLVGDLNSIKGVKARHMEF